MWVGVIAPGLRISEEALFDRTAQLPRVELHPPPHVIGKNTVHAMQSGLFYGYAGLVDAVITRIRGRTRPPRQGGGDRAVTPTCSRPISEGIDEVDAFLTLRGLGAFCIGRMLRSSPW